ncbi:HPt (histidine-containing phosphotransfer) domain-containing protein [Fodinibius salinus]|uniref:HPt (Histidine-containing phosphotransfer) domain-containing protein n=1 Tax=Fodinibius salinus TaxID=860790 RepID=A0A5D3YGD8_9BACT|nr:Hpt domain-containing protein [Fodinibius salinus]TYP92188.1 HPt (histidine-containing phosphotransfer) domain-containing protein [Fodinibius salinus]
MPKENITDLSTLHEMSMGDDSIIIETVEAFLEDIPGTLDDMQELHAKRAYEDLADLAHKIKPNIGYMGMTEGQEPIIAIEKAAEDKDPEGILDEKVPAFVKICNQAFDELAQKVEELKS